MPSKRKRTDTHHDAAAGDEAKPEEDAQHPAVRPATLPPAPQNFNLLDSIPPDVLSTVLSDHAAPPDVCRVGQCSGTLRDVCRSGPVRSSVLGRLLGAGMTRVFHVHESLSSPVDETTDVETLAERISNGGVDSMRTLSAAEAYLYDRYYTGDGRAGVRRNSSVGVRRNSMHWKDAFAKASRAIEEEVRPYEKEKVVEGHTNFGQDEISQFLCDSEYGTGAQLCYGIALPRQELLKAMCIGRRWYCCHHLVGFPCYHPRSSVDKATILWSQPLSEHPYEGEGAYSEFYTEKDFEDYDISYGTEKGLDKSAKTRPAGAKAWNGPSLNLHLSTALDDTVKRAGLTPALVDLRFTRVEGGTANIEARCEISAEATIQFISTGQFSEEGDHEVVLGIKIGQDLPADCFDIFHATGGRRLFQDGVKCPYFGGDIECVSRAYVAALTEWAEDSFQFRAFEDALQERVWKVLQTIPSYALGGEKEVSKEDLGFFLVAHNN